MCLTRPRRRRPRAPAARSSWQAWHMGDVLIRDASIDDATAVLAIYAPVVEHTAISFELAAPTVDEMGARMERITSRYPWLVAELDDCVVGYAYAGPHSDRGAYRWTVEA